MRRILARKFDVVQTLLGFCSLINIFVLLLFGMSLLKIQGPIPLGLVFEGSHQTYFKYLPDAVIHFLPYWWGGGEHYLLIFHGFILIFFMMNLFPKVIVPLLFLLEFGLHTRNSFVVHEGQALFVLILLFYTFKAYAPSSRQWIFSALWVSQGVLIYFFSGLYKDMGLWLIKGSAIQDFLQLFQQMSGERITDLGQLGIWFSRSAVLCEMIGSLVLLFCYLCSKKIKPWPLSLSLLLLSSIHIGSFFFFGIFTFPLIGLTYLLGVFFEFPSMVEIPFKKKALVLILVIPFHLFTALGWSYFPFDAFPLRQNWRLFSGIPPVKAYYVGSRIETNEGESYEFPFSQSFHWERYKVYLSDENRLNKVFRKNFNHYACSDLSAKMLTWESFNQRNTYVCKTKP